MINGRAQLAVALILLLVIARAHARGFLGVVLRPGQATIADVLPDSPAAQAGFAKGDTVVAVNGVAVKNSASFIGAVQSVEVGELVKVKVQRDGTERVLTAKIADGLPYRPQTADLRATEQPNGEDFFQIKQQAGAVGFNYYKFTLIRIGNDIFALHVLPDPRFGGGGGITYRWFSTRDGSDLFISSITKIADGSTQPSHPVDVGFGETHEIDHGIGAVSVGKTELEWSMHDNHSGWLYFRNSDESTWVYSKQFDRFAEFSQRLRSANWIQMSTGKSRPAE